MNEARLVGRDAELGVLVQALDGLRQGQAGCVAVVGEAGIGKTRLLDELATRVTGQRARLLRGRAAEFERQVPFALVADALDRYLGGVGAGRLSTLGDERLAELAAVFPSLAAPESSSLRTQAERFRRHFAVRALLERIGEERPLVLVLDDVHWADEASVELLAHLVRRGFRQPVLLVLAYRPHGAPELLAAAVESAARDGGLERVALDPLGIEHAEALMTAVDPALRPQLFQESGGNPFYLEQLARAPLAESARRALLLGEADDDGGPAGVPSAVRASLRQELDRLSAPAQALSQAAAVLGEPFDPELAAEVAGLGQHTALAALDELIAAGLARPTATPRSLAFRHPIVRRAVYHSIGKGSLLTAHERSAEALRARGQAALLIAPHVERSARPGDEGAIELLTQAGHAATGPAPSTAARCYTAALRLMPTGAAASERRFGVLMALAGALGGTGRLGETCDALDEALALLPPDATEGRAGLVTMLAQTRAAGGGSLEARTLLVAALDTFDGARERAPLTLMMAVNEQMYGDRNEAARWGAEALAHAEEIGDRVLEAASAAVLSMIDHALGSIPAARRHAQQAAALVDRLPDDDLPRQPIAPLIYLTNAEAMIGEYERAIEHGERALAVARKNGRALLSVSMSFCIALSELALGRLDEAARRTEDVLDAARMLGIGQNLCWAWMLSGRLALLRGDVGLAVRASEEAVGYTGAAPQNQFSQLAHRALAEARIAAGEPERARDRLIERSGGPDLPLVHAGARAAWCEVLMEAELALGGTEAAQAWALRAEQAVDDSYWPAQRGAADRARALVLLAEGDAGAAVEHAGAAQAAFAAEGMRVDAARAGTLLGRALAQVGDTAAAVEALSAAHAELDACGAIRARDEAAHELRRHAHPVPGRRRRARQDLTAREREVADLVARGNTNKQVGAALRLSERTVENHVAHIFGKLGIASRGEIAREQAAGSR